jgi:thymidylate synthase (FAD)
MPSITASYEDHYGSDESIIRRAKVSFAKGEEEVDIESLNAKGLINYLARGMSSTDWMNIHTEMYEGVDTPEALIKRLRHTPTHWIPFAHTAITINCTAPVPIRTQCFKHKQGLVESEESRRYIKSTPQVFTPEFRLAPAGNIKQGSAGEHPHNPEWQEAYKGSVMEAVRLYEAMLLDNVCPEQARFILPQGTMVNWVWTGNLYAFANLYHARSDSHAQQEIQELAKQIDAIIRPLFPLSWAALVDQ